MDTPRAILGFGRAAIGIGGWLAPELTARAFGIRPEESDRFITRLFACREMVLAGAVLAAPDSTQLARAARVGGVVDAIDSAAGLDEWRRGNLSKQALLMGPVGVLGLSALGFYVAFRAEAD